MLCPKLDRKARNYFLYKDKKYSYIYIISYLIFRLFLLLYIIKQEKIIFFSLLLNNLNNHLTFFLSVIFYCLFSLNQPLNEIELIV